MSRFFKFIDIYYLIKKMLDNIVIFMIPGLPLWVEIHYDFGDDFSQQFPGMIAGMALRFFLNTLAFQLLLRPSPNSGPLLGPSGPPHLSYLRAPLICLSRPSDGVGLKLGFGRLRTPSVQCRKAL